MSKKAMAKIVEISKQELSTEKVELALVDDYNKRIDKANNERAEAAVSLNRTELRLGNAITQLELAIKEGNNIEKAAKDLGVKSPVDMSKVQAKLNQFKKALNAIKTVSIKN